MSVFLICINVLFTRPTYVSKQKSIKREKAVIKDLVTDFHNLYEQVDCEVMIQAKYLNIRPPNPKCSKSEITSEALDIPNLGILGLESDETKKLQQQLKDTQDKLKHIQSELGIEKSMQQLAKSTYPDSSHCSSGSPAQCAGTNSTRQPA